MGVASPLVTVFSDKQGTRINTVREMDFEELERVIRAVKPAPAKENLPLLKLARFGESRSERGALRHDANVVEVFGIEGDYDDKSMPMGHAAELLSARGIAALLYTSASHEPAAPKWRVIVALANTLEGNETELYLQRRHWTGVLNAILGGVLKSESFVLSQCYFFGAIYGKPQPEIIRLSGICLDQLEDAPLPIYPDREPKKEKQQTNWDVRTDQELKDNFARGEDRHQSMLSLSGRWAVRGMLPADIEASLHALLDLCPNGTKNSDGVDFRDRCHRVAVTAYERFYETRARRQPSTGENPTFAKPSTDSAEEAPWPDPVNILGELQAPEFDGSEVPQCLAEFPLVYARSTGFDPSLAIAAAVTVAAASISDKFQIIGDSRSNWFQQARLWMLTIGRPGVGKSPVQKAMLSPLWEIQHELTAEYQRSLEEAVEGDPKPTLPRIIIGDTTMEALSERLRGNERGVLIANDEFESWLGSHDAYRGGGASRDRGEWLRLFDGGPHTIERIQRGSVFIPNWGASILTATTPSALKKLTRNLPEDGLLQRFIPIIGRSKGEASESVGEIANCRDRYSQTVKRLFRAVPNAHSGCVSMSFEAQAFLKSWLRKNQIAQEAFGSMEPALESHLSKYPAFILRLALTFHCATVVCNENALARDPAAWTISRETMEIAAAFLKRATLHAVALYLDRKSGSEVFDLAREVARTITAKHEKWGTIVAKRDLIQSVFPFRKADEDRQGAVLRLLVDLGWLRYSPTGYSKAIPASYDLNPKVAVKFAAEGAREAQRRAAVTEIIREAQQQNRGDRP